ncbi:MAG: hypothetical protein ABR987_18750 [Terracidiphilus sp.]
MNGAQAYPVAQTCLFAKLKRVAGSVSEPPAAAARPTHREKAAMNGAQAYPVAQTCLFAKLKRVAGSVSGPPTSAGRLFMESAARKKSPPKELVASEALALHKDNSGDQ